MHFEHVVLSIYDKEVIFNNICHDLYGVNYCPISFSTISSKLDDINDPEIIKNIIIDHLKEFDYSPNNVQHCLENSSYLDYITTENILIVSGVLLSIYIGWYYILPPVIRYLESFSDDSSSSGNDSKSSGDFSVSSTEIIEPVVSPTEIIEPVVSPTEIIEPIVVSPESIIGPNFQYTNPADDEQLMELANIIDNITDPVVKQQIISIMHECLDIDKMLFILEQFIS